MYIFCFTLFLIYLSVATPIVQLTKKDMLPAALDFLQAKELMTITPSRYQRP